jgi:ABC-type polysaccharide/polyol phosphate transport system ATPase subunit
MPASAAYQQPEAVIELRDAAKAVVQGVNLVYKAFQGLSLDVYAGERLAVFGVNGFEAKALVACLSGVEPLDSGTLDHKASVSWPMGSNEAFQGKLTGYMNARFAAEVYSQPGQIENDLRLIQDLSGVDDLIYHQPFGEWPSALKDALKLAVSLAFEFDVITVGRISGWNHQAIHPQSVRIRNCFEQRIDGRTLLLCANGQYSLAMDYCQEGLVLVGGELIYRGDPEVCAELVKEEAKRQKQERRVRVNKRIAKLVGGEGVADSDGGEFPDDDQDGDDQELQPAPR